MDELFNIIGKLYVDLVQSQKYIENIQKQLQSKNQELASVQNTIQKKESD